MVAVKLQLVSLALVMALNHLSSMVDVSGVLMRDILYDDSRCIRLSLNLYDILIDIIKQLVVPPVL